ncbi:hypothetical protein [Flavobacterium sp.]|uniref:hypothetical protein n=1 Tax=Flavobacterium sp. TaxID=239 RepID=UPI0025C5E76F|nr:hypothetical protein [Flavobacterium sp.]|tara:strand:+ start:2165 stop:3373 length:1209 start_codon:yes stop_codon:yes gene_type:complete
MKKWISLVLLFVSFWGWSQNYKAEIKNIQEDGFHQIQLSSEIRAVANENLAFLRILDTTKKEVPYVISNFKGESENYISFKILSKNSIKDSITAIVIQNETGKKINQLNLKIGNAALTKQYQVSGSYDQEEWFGLVANETLKDLVATKGIDLEKTIYFPVNDYPYLRIEFNDKKSLPINIQAIGINENQFLPDELIEVNAFTYKIIEDKERKVTQIVFSAQKKYQIDAISFAIATELYAREARITIKKEIKNKKSTTIRDGLLSSFLLNSKMDSKIRVSNLNEKEFTIEIENKDNQPLEIQNIQLFQKPITIISRLKANEKYEVVIDSTYSKPIYDLVNFMESFTVGMPKATITNFYKIEKEKHIKGKSFWQTNLFMWICIVLGIGIVVYFALGLLKDMKNE